MLWVDYLIIGIVLVSAVIGLFRGFIKEVISVVTWIVAFFVALYFTVPASGLLENSISTPSLRKAVAGAVLFVGVLLAGGIINFLIGKLVLKSGLAGTDRTLGGVFGLVRGGAVVLLLMLLAALTPMPKDPWWRESTIIPHMEPYAIQVRNLLPPDVAKHFEFSSPEPAAPTQS